MIENQLYLWKKFNAEKVKAYKAQGKSDLEIDSLIVQLLEIESKRPCPSSSSTVKMVW